MEAYELYEAVEKLERMSEQYEQYRTLAAENKLKFDYILASKLPDYYKIKKNIGYDSARLLLLSEAREEEKTYDRLYHQNEAKYKALEKIIDAIREKIHLGKFLGRIE